MRTTEEVAEWPQRGDVVYMRCGHTYYEVESAGPVFAVVRRTSLRSRLHNNVSRFVLALPIWHDLVMFGSCSVGFAVPQNGGP